MVQIPFSHRQFFSKTLAIFSIFVVGCLVTSCENGVQTTSNTSNQPPNIIVLFADDMGYGDIGTYGHPTIHTPNLDRMANEGVKLTEFYVGSSVCTPSRAALMTGRLPIRSGMCSSKRAVLFPDSNGGIPEEEITIAESLRQSGYFTSIVGKWHLGHLPQFLPTNNGFDYFFGIPYSNDMSPKQTDWAPAKKFPPIPLMENTEVMEEEPNQKLLTRRYTEKAKTLIEQHADQPFFLYLAYAFPHVPLYASDEFEGKSKRGLYGDVVEELDWSVGQILDKLKETGLDKNTLVFFSSDNGPWLNRGIEGGSAGLLREGKGSTFEGGMRVPGIAWWPQTLPAGATVSGISTTMDLFPTFTLLAGGNIPTDRVMDGADLMPLLTGAKKEIRDELVYYKGQKIYAIRKGKWKVHYGIVEDSHVGKRNVGNLEHPLLFNLEEDPSERYDLAAEHPEILASFQAIKEKHISELKAKPTQLEL